MSTRWKIKRFSNDELRQKFIDQAVPQAAILGLEVPDADLEWDEEAGHYRYGAIDWDEFNRVVRGDGPCNRQRLAEHKRVHDEGSWVREAVAAYQRKHEEATDA
jgi:ring-1,2-phenylacetyl-CoA epoxidase subunit PaaA